MHDSGRDILDPNVNSLTAEPSSRTVTKYAPHWHWRLNREQYEILDQEAFRRILRWERKRAERSRKFFLLMLIDPRKLLLSHHRDRVLPEILSALACSLRETDIVGWYEQSGTVGVIFTEIRETDSSAIVDLMRAKVSTPLRSKLGEEQADKIHLSFHYFPQQLNKPDVSCLTDASGDPELLERGNGRSVSHFVKRATDIVGSVIALILGSPLFVAVSLAVKLTSQGPVLFEQERVGQYGVRFTLLKFRSMEVASDPGIHQEYVKQFISGKVSTPAGANDDVVFKIQNDPRVTRIGNFLRKTSLDELPQFINVLRGEMSLVGPRPPIPYELENYDLWHRRRILEAKPGITGLWQVNGRSRTSFDDMVRLDLKYAKRWSPWLDIKILLQTPRAVLSRQGAC